MDENPDYNEQNASALPAEIVRIKKEEKLQIYNPEDVDIFYDALSHLDFQGQVSKDYEDNFSLEDSTKIKNLLNQNGHSKNICWNKIFCSSLKEEPPESQTLGHFWDKNWMPLIKNELLFII